MALPISAPDNSLGEPSSALSTFSVWTDMRGSLWPMSEVYIGEPQAVKLALCIALSQSSVMALVDASIASARWLVGCCFTVPDTAPPTLLLPSTSLTFASDFVGVPPIKRGGG